MEFISFGYLFSTGPIRTNLSPISIQIQAYAVKEMHLKISSA